MNSLPRWIRAGCSEPAETWRCDVTAGSLVFLIALPLCLGIAMASDFLPPMAAMISAIVGGVVVSRINGSRLGINGPAAGLITVLFASVHSLGDGDAWAGYRYTLAAIVVGGLQMVFGWLKAGRWATFFPAAVAIAIGVKLLIRRARGVRLKNLFELSCRVMREDGNTCRIRINGAAIFANCMVLKSELAEIPAGNTVIFDLTYASLVDHTVMDILDRHRRDYIARGGRRSWGVWARGEA